MNATDARSGRRFDVIKRLAPRPSPGTSTGPVSKDAGNVTNTIDTRANAVPNMGELANSGYICTTFL